MALLETPLKDDNFYAPDFKLQNIDGKFLTYNDIKGKKGTVIAFICNHCPYVQAIIERFVQDAQTLQDLGIAVAAIMPNDTGNYPADSQENMVLFAEENGFTFPYLIDETQEVARSYGAVCTPDIFGFNANGQLQYRGRLDSAGPNEATSKTVKELVNAMTQIAQDGVGPANQTPSMGCSIKWK
ncbi:MAG: thioredoxin family protein [Rhodospirillales bacterium]|nr:thioredoxin family protein [Alphaproteobacteria bacterium]USO05411.1 MAG: thioredoxin family protein [Rhodospirillales bacterium]